MISLVKHWTRNSLLSALTTDLSDFLSSRFIVSPLWYSLKNFSFVLLISDKPRISYYDYDSPILGRGNVVLLTTSLCTLYLVVPCMGYLIVVVWSFSRNPSRLSLSGLSSIVLILISQIVLPLVTRVFRCLLFHWLVSLNWENDLSSPRVGTDVTNSGSLVEFW